MAKNKKENICAHIINHVHWDREWRYPIWETRDMLIEFMDELLEALENGLCKSFLFDGQVVSILDYLEFYPEKKEQIIKFVKQGKLLIGPWYTLPDEYPVDGEALVRNLLWGNRVCEKLGGVFNVGYTSFGWGQTAQLPQIYAGFGIDIAMIGKRIRIERAPNSEFLWEAPDGTTLLTTRFGKRGRQNFYLTFHLSALYNVIHDTDDWFYDWENAYIAYHRADKEKMEQDHFMLDTPRKWGEDVITQELIDELWKTTDESLIDDHRLMMNGCDYTAFQNMLPQLIEILNKKDKKKRKWMQSSMPDFLKIMNEKLDRSKLKIVKGELRDGPAEEVTGNALSTRLYIKQLNKKAQNILIRYAEPFANLTALLGMKINEKFLNKAWKYLLEAHPHDSINGVTQDKTADDNVYRLNQVIELANTVLEKSFKQIIRNLNTDKFKKNDVLLVAFNPLPYTAENVLEAWVNMPKETDGLIVYDAAGKPLDTQWEGYEDEGYPAAEIHTRAKPYFCKRNRIFFKTGEVPAYGYKVFSVSEIDFKKAEKAKISWTNSEAQTGNILKSPFVMENEFLKVEFNSNGTFNLTSKKLKKTFSNLNYYEDKGDCGTYWVNKKPMFNKIYNSLGCSAKLWCEENGPLQATMASEITLSLPDRVIPKENRRSDKLVELVIKTYVTLRAGAEEVEVNVEFENKHQDHYLRAMFPTGITNAKFSDAGGHFYVDRRPVKIQGPTPNSTWPDMATLPHNNFVDISDKNYGIAFINNCLMEYEVLNDSEKTVALTLLKAAKNWIITMERMGSDFPSQKGGQCFGKHKLKYAIRPHKGNWQEANIPLAAEKFNIPMIPIQTSAHKGRMSGSEFSLFQISNTAIRFSALKKSEKSESLILRIYNPTNKTQKGDLIFTNKIKKAWLTNLNEKREKEITLVSKNKIQITIKSNKILTLEIKFK